MLFGINGFGKIVLIATPRQMHRDLKLQHALLQQIAQKVGVTEEATAEMRELVEAAPEGAPIAALLRTPPLTKSEDDDKLTNAAAEVEKASTKSSRSYSRAEEAAKEV